MRAASLGSTVCVAREWPWFDCALGLISLGIVNTSRPSSGVPGVCSVHMSTHRDAFQGASSHQDAVEGAMNSSKKTVAHRIPAARSVPNDENRNSSSCYRPITVEGISRPWAARSDKYFLLFTFRLLSPPPAFHRVNCGPRLQGLGLTRSVGVGKSMF